MTTLAMRKPHADRRIEGMMAKWYANNTGEMMKEYVDLAQQNCQPNCPRAAACWKLRQGQAISALSWRKLGPYAITGLDLSHTFVKMAAEKAADAGVKVDFIQGSASNMPFPEESFDFLLCRAAFKNFANPVGALQEMCRVLKPRRTSASDRSEVEVLRRTTSATQSTRWVCPLSTAS